jgi:ribonuclease HII
MPVPWLQIVRLMPSILNVSRELLKRTRKFPSDEEQALLEGASAGSIESRIISLEENERRQAELVTSMADQLAQLTSAASVLHKVTRWLILGQVVTGVVAVVALVVALR